MSLKAELIGATAAFPGFAVLLPPGWGSWKSDPDTLRERLNVSLANIPLAQRGALKSGLMSALDRSLSHSGAENIIQIFGQTESTPEDYLPMSLAASRIDAPTGTTIAELGAAFMGSRSAAPMDSARSILRWANTSDVPVDDGKVSALTINYLAQVPEQTTFGLLFQANILAGADGTTVEQTPIDSMTRLADAIVSTLRWERRA